MKCSCPCGRPAGRCQVVLFVFLYVNDGSFSLERSYQLSGLSMNEQHEEKGYDLSWWQLSTDQDCSLVEYWLGSGRKKLGLDAWTVELVSSMHAPAGRWPQEQLDREVQRKCPTAVRNAAAVRNHEVVRLGSASLTRRCFGLKPPDRKQTGRSAANPRFYVATNWTVMFRLSDRNRRWIFGRSSYYVRRSQWRMQTTKTVKVLISMSGFLFYYQDSFRQEINMSLRMSMIPCLPYYLLVFVLSHLGIFFNLELATSAKKNVHMAGMCLRCTT